MTAALAILAGLLALVGAAYLAGLLRAIRRHDYGEGRLLEIHELGISLRSPEWWKIEPPSPADRPGGHAVVTLKTGHQRGLLRIEGLPWTAGEERVLGEHEESPTAALRSALEVVLEREGVILDDPSIRVVPIAPSPGGAEGPVSHPGAPGTTRLRLRASVASAGRARTEAERAYYEFHLIEADGRRVLFAYTNSVLQGYLDAFYLERIFATIRPGGR